MRVLTVKSPWGHLIAQGRKTIEARSWSTKYRGPIAFVQGLGINEHAMRAHDLRVDQVRRGAIVVVRNLVEVRSIRQSDSDAACFDVEPDSEDFAWLLDGGCVIDPIPMAGTLGLVRASHVLTRLLRERQAA